VVLQLKTLTDETKCNQNYNWN